MVTADAPVRKTNTIQRAGPDHAHAGPRVRNAGYDSVSDARAALGRYPDFHNSRRPHSSLGARTPERAYLDALPRRMAA